LGGVIARPSVLLKIPSLNEALKPLYGLEATAKQAYEEASGAYEIELEAFKAQKEALKADMLAAAKGKKNARLDMEAAKNALKNLKAPEAPIWHRYRTNDSTVEKLGELLKENPRGLLIFRDELIGFLAALDREDRKSDRGFYLEAWNGYGNYLYDRIGRGTVPVENCCVSILGGIQPAKLLAYLHQAMDPMRDDGLLQRFQLLVYPDEPREWDLVDCYPDKEAKERALDILKNLADMNFTNRGALLDKYTPCPYFQFGPKAQEVFDGWLGELEARIRGQADDHPLLIEHLGKYRSLMPLRAAMEEATTWIRVAVFGVTRRRP
jgi:putative DNA primase/helicase